MNTIYYVQANLCCVVILLLIALHISQELRKNSTDQVIFLYLIWSTVIICISDLFAGVERGKLFSGARQIIEISNWLYFISMLAVSCAWALYVNVRLGFIIKIKSKRTLLILLPALIFVLLSFTNFHTHFIFTIDENNIYHRSYGVLVHWLLLWSYLLIPTARAIYKFNREHNRQRRQEIRPLLLFSIAPAIAGVIQMAFYGVTITQFGITVSILIIYLEVQKNQVLTDSMTGLNNRHGLERYIYNTLGLHDGQDFCALLIDLNSLKQINDTYGHMAGDLAICATAVSLKEACAEGVDRLFICRYGGDEFLIVGTNRTDSDLDHLKDRIRDILEQKNNEHEYEFRLQVSIGSDHAYCKSIEDVYKLIHSADNAMYENKKLIKRQSIDNSPDNFESA